MDQDDEGVPSTAMREISLLKEMQHGNIVSSPPCGRMAKLILILLLFLQLAVFASPPISSPWRRNSEILISTSTTSSRTGTCPVIQLLPNLDETCSPPPPPRMADIPTGVLYDLDWLDDYHEDEPWESRMPDIPTDDLDDLYEDGPWESRMANIPTDDLDDLYEDGPWESRMAHIPTVDPDDDIHTLLSMLDLEGLRDLEKWLKEKPAGKSLEADIPTDDPGDDMSRLDVKDLMDLKKQRVKKPAWKNLKAEIPTGDIVHELRLTMDGQKLRIHGIWIGTLKVDDVEHIKNQHKTTIIQQRIVAKQELKALEDSYKEHLEKFWYHETLPDFWVYEASSHGSYSRTVHMIDYIRTTATYGLPFLEGGDHDLMKILAELGHKFGDLINDDPDDDMSRLDVKHLMDLKEQRVKKPAWKSLKADIVHELRLTMDGQVLRIHGIWIGTLKGGDVEHLKNQHKATQSQRGIFAKQEREALEDSYKEHLQKFWYHETWGPVSDFWVYEASSHGSYSRSVHRTDYIRTTATYGLCFVEGGDHDLMKILAELGHKFGNLINGRELVQDLKKLLGVDVFLIFKEKDNFPCLYEIGIFYSYIWELIDYPIATTRLPTGLFKLC